MTEVPIWIPTPLRTKLNDIWPSFRFRSNSLGIATLTILCWRRESCQGIAVIREMDFVGEINPNGEINSIGEESSAWDFAVFEK